MKKKLFEYLISLLVLDPDFVIILMISNIVIRNTLRSLRTPLYRVHHIKNMIKENARE